ncbi:MULTISPECIES: transporter substrate-binding domain-containing protein [Paenochrobactrum]|uniref:transporter substrate-binding domain-containing protein n=1 Tax=Paenochrobactrum pullorum TaxID=1324351 RepID=UPI0035BBF973
MWKVLALAAAFTASIHSAQAADGEIIIGTEGAYPPWSIADANGNVTGFDAEVGQAVCDKMEAKCRFVVQAFDGLIPALKAKQIDAIISGMSITNERKKEIGFSKGYGDLPNFFVVQKSDDLASITDWETLLKALADKRVGVQSGTTHALYINKYLPNVDLKTYDSLDQMQIDLASGRVDVSFSDLSAADDFLAKADGSAFQLINVPIDSKSDETLGDAVGIGLRKDDTDLKAKIDVALCAAIADGTIGKASVKWFKMDITHPCE